MDVFKLDESSDSRKKESLKPTGRSGSLVRMLDASAAQGFVKRLGCLTTVSRFSRRATPPSTNIAPAEGYLEDQFPLQATLCEVLC